MPYRTLEDLIDGVVITFLDITAAKKLEEELRTEIAQLKGAPGATAESSA
jgi:two-component system CheB/CheR fusion protein